MPLSRPQPQRFWCNWSGVKLPGRYPGFQKLPRWFTSADQAENHWARVRSQHLQTFKSSTGNLDLQPGLRTAAYTSCCLSLGFINGKALLSKNNSVNKYGRAHPCTAVYHLRYIMEETMGPAVTSFLTCNRFNANSFLDFCLSWTSWRMIYETDGSRVLSCRWEKENEYLVYWAKG